MRPSSFGRAALCLLAFLLLACGGDRDREPGGRERDASHSGDEGEAFHGPLPEPHAWSGEGCTRAECHGGEGGGIEAIRDPESEMMRQIFTRGREVGDRDGCVVCHGGTPEAETAELAHAGTIPALEEEGGPDTFFPDPASPWVNSRSCGPCHEVHVRTQWSSLMMTEAGKVQGTTWGFGSLEGYEHRWANYDRDNPEDPHARMGTEAYRLYMELKREAHPNVFPEHQETMPEAPSRSTLDQLREHPERAAFTYLRSECQRCHLGVRGRQRRGDFRGMGCGACHIPYGNEGRYEGGDRTIDPEEPGHLLVHSIQATREARVRVGEVAYSGIPVETCTTCHNRGKRIGVSYQGLMESAYGSPFTEGGGGQIGLHTKHYIQMERDVHYQRGMLCQDCHTSIDVHGDGFLAGTNLAAVEIECSDCHGTPSAYPWELPLGWGDENEPRAAEGEARGVAHELAEYLRQGSPAEERGGYLLSARGNPMPEVVRDGQEVIVHTASGRDLRLRPLRALNEEEELSAEARTAMVNVDRHMETMECYTCHTQWAPQCYGCHIRIDYSGDSEVFDWVQAGHEHMEAEHRATRGEQGFDVLIPGRVTELRSYLRWEDPPLGMNGEGRVTPLIPGCQTSVTVIGQDGEELIRNWIFRTTPHTEGGGEEGQLAIDMSPVHPHTVGPSRSCESCHTDPRALGYGIEGVEPRWDQAAVVDLTTADGRVIPRGARPQIEAMRGLDHDWSQLVTEEGRQLQTVGHHWAGSGPLSDAQRENIARQGACVGCHQEIPEGSLAVSALHHAAEMSGQIPRDREAHQGLLDKIALTSAWAQVGGAFFLGGGVFALLFFSIRKIVRRRRDKES